VGYLIDRDREDETFVLAPPALGFFRFRPTADL